MASIEKIVCCLLLIIMAVCLCMTTTHMANAEEMTIGMYNTAAVNLREMPTYKGALIGRANQGATCEILEEATVGDTRWYYVKVTSTTVNKKNLKGYKGWSVAEYITLEEDKSEEIMDSEELEQDDVLSEAVLLDEQTTLPDVKTEHDEEENEETGHG